MTIAATTGSNPQPSAKISVIAQLWLFVFTDPAGLIYRTLGALGPNQIAPEIAAVAAAVFCFVVRYRNHPFASRLTLSGEVRTRAAS